jgi:riboflavin kinase/FMN adenylyltransferase
MVVGENFRFGHKRAGDVAFAREHLGRARREVVAVPNEQLDGERVSSTRIRAAIAAGDLELADRLLGAPYTSAAGDVRRRARPRSRLSDRERRRAAGKLLPPDGVYRDRRAPRRARLSGAGLDRNEPDLRRVARTVEAWLLDFNGSLYGEELWPCASFRFVRAQRRFDSVDELIAQMRADAATVREVPVGRLSCNPAERHGVLSTVRIRSLLAVAARRPRADYARAPRCVGSTTAAGTSGTRFLAACSRP